MIDDHEFNYDSKYFDCKMSGWTGLSFEIISGNLLRALQQHGYSRNGVVVDFGCGTGVYCASLLKTGLKVVGIDVSHSALAEAEKKPYDQVILVESDKVPLPSGSVSVLFTTEVLEHIEDDHAAVAEFSRLLEPGGIAILTTTLYFSSINTYLSTAIIQKHSVGFVLLQFFAYLSGYFSTRRQMTFIRRWCYVPLGGHFHGFHIRQLERLFLSNGFEVSQVTPMFIFQPFGVGKWLDRKVLSSAPFKKQLIWTVPMICVWCLNVVLRKFKFTANNIFLVVRRA